MASSGSKIAKAILTPCIGICEVGPGDRCVGCLRTLDEIARWGSMDETERLRIMRELLPQRAAPPAHPRG